jgi:hypothetical protein
MSRPAGCPKKLIGSSLDTVGVKVGVGVKKTVGVGSSGVNVATMTGSGVSVAGMGVQVGCAAKVSCTAVATASGAGVTDWRGPHADIIKTRKSENVESLRIVSSFVSKTCEPNYSLKRHEKRMGLG